VHQIRKVLKTELRQRAATDVMGGAAHAGVDDWSVNDI
jgi:hypothetical protein